MTRTHKQARFALSALLAVVLLAACCLAGLSSTSSTVGSDNATAPNLLATHSSPTSAGSIEANAKLQVTRGGQSTALTPGVLTSAAGVDVAALPRLCAGVSVEPFSLRLRI
ncbi:MAG: hypothetical protein P4L93_00760 [Coriobacteriia bacterium]|nr:hypothetical protein [Coriobacteriia bacterium]